jgi:hypothetical protein
VFDFAEALRVEPHETRYQFISIAERFLGKAPIGDAAGDVPEKGFKGVMWRLLLGRSMHRHPLSIPHHGFYICLQCEKPDLLNRLQATNHKPSSEP